MLNLLQHLVSPVSAFALASGLATAILIIVCSFAPALVATLLNPVGDQQKLQSRSPSISGNTQ